MKFKRYGNYDEFNAAAYEALMTNMIKNNLMLRISAKYTDWDANLLCAILGEDGQPLLCAVCTPPHNAVLVEPFSPVNNDALLLLNKSAEAEGFTFPGVNAESSLAKRFADVCAPDAWATHTRLVSMSLDHPAMACDAPGSLREIRDDDCSLLAYWQHAFHEDCHLMPTDPHSALAGFQAENGKSARFVWEDNGLPVSMAGATTPVGDGICIGLVYTPPVMRGKGYSQACVSQMCNQLMAQKGYTFCVLFADADNPISCHIYRKIGFVDCCTEEDIRFSAIHI